MTHEQIVQISRVVHAANREYKKTIGEEPGPKWRWLDDKDRVELIGAVKNQIENPVTPMESHERWYAAHPGYIYGEAKRTLYSSGVTEHPCALPWDQLPEYQQQKDVLFVGIINAMVKETR